MQTLTTNLNNWTGEEATIKYTKNGSFKFGGYSFSLENIQTFNFESKIIGNGGCFDLRGEGWGDSLTTIHFDGEPNIETMVKKALIWVANYV